jgi:hypothetical protein
MRTLAIVLAAILLVATTAGAQPPLPALEYTPPANFYKTTATNPEDFSSNEVNASVQIYPFRPFSGNLQQAWTQTLLRDWIDPRYRETNVASRPDLSSDPMPGAQAVLQARFVENVSGTLKPHVRLVIVAGGAAAIVDMSANSAASWQRVAPAMAALMSSMRIASGVPTPQVPAQASQATRAYAGVYMGNKQQFRPNLWGGVGSGTFTPSLHFYLFSADGRVYRTFDVLKIPQNGPIGFDFAAAARSDPDNSGQFAIQGDQLLMQFGQGGGTETIRTPVSRTGGFTASGVTYERQ